MEQLLFVHGSKLCRFPNFLLKKESLLHRVYKEGTVFNRFVRSPGHTQCVLVNRTE